jgi:putative molybdopterin biosynthesis protein
MQPSAGPELLTTAEAAEYLRLKERKLYELVAERQIPCTKVTGKWLFPRAALDRWLLAGMVRPSGSALAEPPPIVGGSHDPLLQWALSESRAGLAMLPEGTESGLRRLLAGEVVAAAIHFHDLEGGLDNAGGDANVERLRAEPALQDAVLIGFAAREQGLIVAAGNPLRIGSLREAQERGLRAALRPEGAGAQQLLLALLRKEGLGLHDLKSALIAPTGPDVAQAIGADHADFGVASRAIAMAAGIGFVPLCVERFDLVMRQRDYFRPPLQALLALMREPRFAARAQELGGLDVRGAGAVRWVP